MLKGVDISEHNGKVDFDKLSKEVDFVMIRVTYGKKGIDKKSIYNIENAIKYFIPFGVYLYSYALNIEDAKSEANLLLRLIAPYKEKLSLGIAIDMEDADLYKQNNGMPSNDTLVDIILEEQKIFENEGYDVMLYASSYWFNTKLNSNKLESIKKWVANWNKNYKVDESKYIMHQYTSIGKVKGIEGRVDMNNLYSNLEITNKEILKKDMIRNYPEYTWNTLTKLIENETLKGINGKIELSLDSVRLLVILDRNQKL